MPVPPPRLGSTTRLPGAKSRCCLAMNTPLAHAVGHSSFCYRQLLALPIRSVATTTGTPKTIFFSTAAPANDSSELACRRDRKLHAQLSPCPLKKPNLAALWGGWRWHSACRGVSVRRRGDTTLHCPHPFRPFCLPSALCCCIFRAHTRIPHASRQPCLYHAVGRSCDHIQIGQSAPRLPNFALLSMLVLPEQYC